MTHAYDTILLSGIAEDARNPGLFPRENLFYGGGAVELKDLFLRKGFGASEAAARFPVLNEENSRNRGYSGVDLCTTITLKSILKYSGLTYVWGNLAGLSSDEGREGLKKLLRADSGTVSLSTTFITSEDALRDAASFIRKNAPGKTIILGGAFIRMNTHLAELADITVTGDAEGTYPALLTAIKQSRAIKGIKGIIYSEDGKITRNEPAAPADLDAQPPADWSLTDYGNGENTRVLYESCRGCPYSCKYCTYPMLCRYRYKSAGKIFSEWKFFVEVLGKKQIAVFDSVFSTPKKRLIELCNMISEAGLRVEWQCWIRANDCQEQSTTDLMAKAGCRLVFIGVESASDRILKNMDKKITAEQAERAAQNLLRSGIIPLANIMAGFPGETPETLRETEDFLAKSRIFAYSGNVFQIRDKKAPIMSEKEKYGLKTGSECGEIPAGYTGRWGEYWVTDTMTLAEADSLFRKMTREVSRKGSILFANLFNYEDAARIIASGRVNLDFFSAAMKAYERVAMLEPGEPGYTEARESAWEKLLREFALLKS